MSSSSSAFSRRAGIIARFSENAAALGLGGGTIGHEKAPCRRSAGGAIPSIISERKYPFCSPSSHACFRPGGRRWGGDPVPSDPDIALEPDGDGARRRSWRGG